MSKKDIALFSEQVDMIEGGALDRDLGAAIQEVLQAVQATRLMGEITLKLKIKPEGSDQGLLGSKITTKPPKLPRVKSILFVTRDFQLIDVDPTQAELEFAQQPDVTKGPTKVVDNTSRSA